MITNLDHIVKEVLVVFGKDYDYELEETLILLLRQQMHHTLQINNQLSKDYHIWR